MSLFIGGPLDGRDMHVQRAHNEYSIVQQVPFNAALDFPVNPQDFKKIRYLRHKVGKLDFFALETMSFEEVISILLDCYPRLR